MGRISRKLETLSKVKANEWMNWFGVFAVPALRELMRPSDGGGPGAGGRSHPRLTDTHLQLFVVLQGVVDALRAYTITAQQIDAVHGWLAQLMELLVAAFPKDDGACTPNMHLSLHLRQQLLDFGPPAGWWCQPYERFNGLFKRMPFSASEPATSIALRAFTMLAVMQAAATSQHSRPAHLPSVMQTVRGDSLPLVLAPAPDGSFTHSLHSSDSSGRQHQYSWSEGPQRISHFQRFMAVRDATWPGIQDIKGDESYPGQLLSSRAEVPEVDFTLRLAQLGVPPHIQEANERKRRKNALWVAPRDMTPLSYVRECLHTHYLVHYTADIADCPDYGWTDQEQRAIAQANHLGVKDARSTALKASQETMYRHFGTAHVYDSLALGGEMYGSLCGRSITNSYVAVAFEAEDDRRQQTNVWYGQVHYYVAHEFRGRLHQFAVMRFFDWVGTAHDSTAPSAAGERKKKLPKTCDQAMKQRYGTEPGAQLSFERFPVVTQHLHGRTMQDLVPVQRLLGRWIPCLTDKAAAAAEQNAGLATATIAVCPIPTRMHA